MKEVICEMHEEEKMFYVVHDLIRCKECRYYHPSYCEIWSKYGTVQTQEYGFCYKGKEK